MIWESQYWKKDVIRRAKDLSICKNQRRWLDASFAKLEQNLMIGFYSVRKLIEAKKLSDSTVTKKVSICKYPVREAKRIHLINWDRINELYDLNNGKSVQINIISLCNQFIHSYIFVPELNERNQLQGFFVASDWQKGDSLFYIDVDTIIGLFDLVGNDYPSQWTSKFDENKGDYQVSQK